MSSQAAELEAAVGALARMPAATGLFFDFDGTLSRIVDEPDAAHAVDGAAELLTDLAQRYAVVAVISGRSVSALTERLDIPDVTLIGLYGLERRVGDRVEAIPEAEAARATVRLAAAELGEHFASEPGVFVEPKGLAVSVHFRRAPDPASAMHAAEQVVAEIAERYGLGAPLPGKLVLELKPPIPVDKGVAVRQEIDRNGLRAALVAGDDTGDIPAFAALHDLEIAFRVVVAGPESPVALLSSADYRVDSPEELVAALKPLRAPAAR